MIMEAPASVEIKEVMEPDLDSTEDMSVFGEKISPEKHKLHAGKRRRRTRRGHRGKLAPYSAKNFLGRPKINAPANTTQFIFEDKGLGLDNRFNNDNQAHDSSSSSESEYSPNGSSSIQHRTEEHDIAQRECGSYVDESDRFMTEEFDRMYDDVRAEILRNESPEELTSRCMELESAIHNLQYLLQKESEKRHQIEELLYLEQTNAELVIENQRLRCEQDNHVHETDYEGESDRNLTSTMTHSTNSETACTTSINT